MLVSQLLLLLSLLLPETKIAVQNPIMKRRLSMSKTAIPLPPFFPVAGQLAVEEVARVKTDVKRWLL